MANKKLSQITEEATNLADATKLYVEQGLVSKFVLWSTIKSGIQAIITFLSLPDTPNSFVGQALKFLRVNAGATALEFATISITIDSVLWFHTHAGFGSTDNKIARWSVKVRDTGTAFTHNHDSGYSGNTKGLEVVIAEEGNYVMSYGYRHGTGGAIGISLNSIQLTTAILGINPADRFPMDGATGVADPSGTATAMHLVVGDIIRPHTDGVAPWTAADCIFTIIKVSS